MCAEHGDFVWAYRPDTQIAEWFEIAMPVEGVRVDGGQCETCSLSTMTLRSAGKHSWVAVCEGMEWDGDWLPGCGSRHPVRQKPKVEVEVGFLSS